MAYYDLATLSADNDFLLRCAAAYQLETGAIDPASWAYGHAWPLAGSPGFADAYASAIAGGVEFPGRDPSVITDPQILSAVQPMVDA